LFGSIHTRKSKKKPLQCSGFFIGNRLSFFDPSVTPSWPGDKLAGEDRTGAGFG
jgi:hypothetical protein